MLRRIEWIKDCGIWTDYCWNNSLPSFGRINIIYGPNGSGKTSLAGVLDDLRNASDGAGYKRVSIALDENGTERVTNGSDDSMFDRIHVFSEHYVARNHHFTPAEAEMEAVLTIGQKPVEAELELEELRKTVAAKKKERETAFRDECTANEAIESKRPSAKFHSRLWTLPAMLVGVGVPVAISAPGRFEPCSVTHIRIGSNCLRKTSRIRSVSSTRASPTSFPMT